MGQHYCDSLREGPSVVQAWARVRLAESWVGRRGTQYFNLGLTCPMSEGLCWNEAWLQPGGASHSYGRERLPDVWLPTRHEHLEASSISVFTFRSRECLVNS